MARLNQSFCLGLYLKEGIPLEELIRGAKEIGYAAAELWHREGAPFDELVEVTPNAIRLRKRFLKELDRRRAMRGQG